jgi:SAM-dependent methyltransferase
VKPAHDPKIDYKDLVRRGYDRCAADYDRARRQEAEPALAWLIDHLADGAAVLDLGCGAGVPVARELARHCTVTGIDISGTMIERARANVPAAQFVHGDAMAADFAPSSFDAVVAFYAIFHLPRREHAALFRRIHRWLKPAGYVLATLSLGAEAPYTEDDFFGVTMYWSNYGLSEYRDLLAELEFDLLDTTFIGHGYGSNHQAPEERHPLVLAQKRP